MIMILKILMLIAVILLILDNEVKPYNKIITLLLYGIYVNSF